MKPSKLKKTHKIPIPKQKKKKKTKTKKKKGAVPFNLYPSLGSTPTIPEERSKELQARLDSIFSKHKRNRARMTQLGKVVRSGQTVHFPGDREEYLKKRNKKKKKKGLTRGGTKSRRKKYSKRNR